MTASQVILTLTSPPSKCNQSPTSHDFTQKTGVRLSISCYKDDVPSSSQLQGVLQFGKYFRLVSGMRILGVFCYESTCGCGLYEMMHLLCVIRPNTQILYRIRVRPSLDYHLNFTKRCPCKTGVTMSNHPLGGTF